MKLSALYANDDDLFQPIIFRDGLNVVIAEIRLPQNREKDTHNLGKTTLGMLLDFCLLAKRDRRMFLVKNESLFSSFVFYLELQNHRGEYLTIRRSVSQMSKIGLKRHATPAQDYRSLPAPEWDHWELPFERARLVVDGFLDLRGVGDWDYRKGLGYFLRSQRDYDDVFQLSKYIKHADWKPYVAHVLGLDAESVGEVYRLDAAIEALEHQEDALRAEVGGSEVTASVVAALLLIRQAEIAEFTRSLDSFDFTAADEVITDQLIDQLDVQIADLNEQKYAFAYNQRRIRSALSDDEIKFDTEEVVQLFAELNVAFEGQILKDFDQLVAFNRAITSERRAYLEEELEEVTAQMVPILEELRLLNLQRAQALSSLAGTDSFQRFKDVSSALVEVRAESLALERQRDQLLRIDSIKSEIAHLKELRQQLAGQILTDLATKTDSRYSGPYTETRLYFSRIVKRVLDRDAVLTVDLNSQNHLEFGAEILDERGLATSADKGLSYKKLLCVAFDLAMLRAHLGDAFPRFVFHDGIFEALDPRKKDLLLEVLVEYAEAGVQQIITLLDSDAPPMGTAEADIILRLHDEGDDGRLFKMEAW